MANSKAKKRKKKLKKQMKKQLQNRIKEAPVVPLTFREIEDLKIKEQTDLHNANENAKLERTSIYQMELNKKYGGFVTVKEKYINPNATLIHQCSNCNKEWYARPMWLLTKENQKHICGVSAVRIGEVTKRKSRKLTEMEKLKMYNMADKGISASKIATALGITRQTVSKHLKEAEASKILF